MYFFRSSMTSGKIEVIQVDRTVVDAFECRVKPADDIHHCCCGMLRGMLPRKAHSLLEDEAGDRIIGHAAYDFSTIADNCLRRSGTIGGRA